MPRSLPERPDLRHLRDEARAMQRAAKSEGTVLRLTTAQTLLARTYGFANWPTLKAHVENFAAAPITLSDAQALAEKWFTLSQAGDLKALTRAMAVGKGRLHPARALMQADTRYRKFLDTLVAGLKDARAPVRFDLAHALDSFGDETCREPLVALMDDPVPRVRWMAMHALSCHACGEGLGEIGAPIMQRVARAAMSDPSIQVRRHAAIALGLSGWPDGTPIAKRILAETTDPGLRRAAWFAVTKLEPTKAA